MWAWSGAKKVLLYIVLLDVIIGRLEFIIGRLAIERVEAIGRLEFIIGPRLEFIGRLEFIIGPLLEFIGRLEFIIGLLAIERVEAIGLESIIGLLGSRETHHAEVLEVPWSHDMLVTVNSHRVTIGTASVSVEDNLSRGSLLDHGKARFQVCDILNHGYLLLKRLYPSVHAVEQGYHPRVGR